MKNCPVCNAEYKQKIICHRCKTDLGLLLSVEATAKRYVMESAEHDTRGDYEWMYHAMKRSWSLKKTDESRKALARSALLNGDFALAWGLFHDRA